MYIIGVPEGFDVAERHRLADVFSKVIACIYIHTHYYYTHTHTHTHTHTVAVALVHVLSRVHTK
jgi:hypothetical protein